jgi:hypothetical protein
VSFYYHWTTGDCLASIKTEGLKLSKPTRRTSPVGVPYDVQGGKVWLCDNEHVSEFKKHIKRIKGETPNVLLRVYLNDGAVFPFSPLPGAFFVRFPIPPQFITIEQQHCVPKGRI